MKKVASHADVEIFAPDNSRFSFLKSPYASHMTHCAVDIYYGDFGSEALSPVDGKIIDARCFDAPTPFKDRDSWEYIIAVQQNDLVVKILHVKPGVSINERVSKGDAIGTFIHNGYFIFWNDPVMHVEVRRPGDYLRASNNLSLNPEIKWSNLPQSKALELKCRVEEVNKRYALLSAPSETCGDVKGFAMDGGFLDGYIPCTEEGGFFGTVKPQGFFHPKISTLVTAGGRQIKCAGIAFSLSFSEPRIKVIPRRYGSELFSLGDTVYIRLGFK